MAPDETIQFDPAALQDAKAQLEQVRLEGEQKEIVENLADVACQYIPIKKDAMQGLMIHVVKVWQEATEMTIGALRRAPPEVRVREMTKMHDILRDRLVDMLVIVTQKAALLKGVDQALEHYVKTYSGRPVVE